MLLIFSPRFEEHTTPPGHPERPERARVFANVVARGQDKGWEVVEPRAATRDELARVHDVAYVDGIAATAGRAVMLDPDTFTAPESHEIALLAAGAAVQAMEHALDRREPAFALVRPPGHPPQQTCAMGFCLFNDVAVAGVAGVAGCVYGVRIGAMAVPDGGGNA